MMRSHLNRKKKTSRRVTLLDEGEIRVTKGLENRKVCLKSLRITQHKNMARLRPYDYLDLRDLGEDVYDLSS